MRCYVPFSVTVHVRSQYATCRYDDHRDQILRGGSHQAGENTGSWWGGGGGGGGKPKDEEDLYSYFTTSCYAGYGDGPRVRTRCWVVFCHRNLLEHFTLWSLLRAKSNVNYQNSRVSFSLSPLSSFLKTWLTNHEQPLPFTLGL